MHSLHRWRCLSLVVCMWLFIELRGSYTRSYPRTPAESERRRLLRRATVLARSRALGRGWVVQVSECCPGSLPAATEERGVGGIYAHELKITGSRSCTPLTSLCHNHSTDTTKFNAGAKGGTSKRPAVPTSSPTPRAASTTCRPTRTAEANRGSRRRQRRRSASPPTAPAPAPRTAGI